MAKPTPGQPYIAESGDTLSGIAARAYGNSAEYARIMDANGLTDPDKIITGQNLFIPYIPEVENIQQRFFGGKIEDEGFMIKIEDRVFPVMSGRVLRTMDTPADAWSATIAWEPGLDQKLDELTAPFQYPQASVYLDGELMVSGRLYNVQQRNTSEGRTKELEGASFTSDIVKSHIDKDFQSEATTLEQFCTDVLEKKMGFKVEIDAGVATGSQFKVETANYIETIAQYLRRLANIQNLLLSCTPQGALLLTTAKLDGPVVATIDEEGGQIAETWEGEFNGADLFRTYRAIFSRSKKSNKVDSLVDETVPMYRVMNFKVEEGSVADLSTAAAWKRNRQLAEAMKISLPVTTWYADDGKLWTPNTKVTIKSKTLGVPDGFTFLIRQIEFIWSEKGRTATLNPIPPTLYSNLTPDLPWVKKNVAVEVQDLKLKSGAKS